MLVGLLSIICDILKYWLTLFETMTITLSIPESLKPEDGRFGSGPSKPLPNRSPCSTPAPPPLLLAHHIAAPVKANWSPDS